VASPASCQLTPTAECCTLPPVQAEYTPKGSFGELDGLKTYQTGPTDTGKAILMVYDVFAYSPQILQGESPSGPM
jgi:hypothetical protein